MQQAGKLRQSIARLQRRLKAALKDKAAASLFAGDDHVDDLIVAAKGDLSTLPAHIGELQAKGRQAKVLADVVKAIVAVMQSELLDAGRDFGKLIEKHAAATKTKEDRRQKLDLGRGDHGRPA